MRADEKGHWKRTDLVLAEAGGGGLMNISGKRLLFWTGWRKTRAAAAVRASRVKKQQPVWQLWGFDRIFILQWNIRLSDSLLTDADWGISTFLRTRLNHFVLLPGHGLLVLWFHLVLLLPGSGRPLLHFLHCPPVCHQPWPILVRHQSGELQPQTYSPADQNDDQHRVAHIYCHLVPTAANDPQRGSGDVRRE